MLSPDEIRKKNQRTIIMMVGAFILPVVIAYLVYIGSDFTKTRNNGELITPPRPLTELKLTGIDNKAFSFEELKGNWHLVYIGNEHCDQVCQDILSKMHQTRMGQGKAMSRVDLIYIHPGKLNSPMAQKLTKSYSRLKILGYDASFSPVLNRLFGKAPQENVIKANRVYMIDPLGNLMMRYNHDARLIGIIKDLEHLLRISQVG
ncbi:MAG: SCO family protein [Gammaproteobacteria bacterium]|nr:SCO family protein [Gammaproteobacteria bacterium]MDH5778860.1 SCO family protein [Gammaproteobacteria bacterium]